MAEIKDSKLAKFAFANPVQVKSIAGIIITIVGVSDVVAQRWALGAVLVLWVLTGGLAAKRTKDQPSTGTWTSNGS